jgi:hypothetical protein
MVKHCYGGNMFGLQIRSKAKIYGNLLLGVARRLRRKARYVDSLRVTNVDKLVMDSTLHVALNRRHHLPQCHGRVAGTRDRPLFE